MNKQHPYLVFLSLTVCLALLSALCAHWNTVPITDALRAATNTSTRIRRVVLDAGHGGEDGGACSADGILEKDLNLSIVFLLRDLLVANGIEVTLTRDTDTLLYDKTADYHGRKKALDFAERKRIAEENADSVFVSIHMNTYPREDCRGLQVWYSPNHPDSRTLANALQNSVKTRLQPQNHREIKASGSNIYLLYHLQIPAVLIECGFLSTPDEAALLNRRDYQKALAFSLFLAIAETSFPI